MKTPRLAQCPRCHGFVLLADDAGLAVAVDVGALSKQGWVNAVVGGVGLWWVTPAADGTPGRLRPLVGRPGISWSLEGAQTGSQRLHQEHSCGALHQDMRVIPRKGADTGPPRASATSGGVPAGNRPLAALAGAAAPSSPAATASPLRSETPVLGRCGICGRKVRFDEEYWAITHGAEWIAGEHEECP